MAEVRRLEADAFDEICPVLLQPMNPRIPREVWERTFRPPWPAPEPTVGYGLYQPGSGWVGFVGTVRATVVVGGKTAQLCNLTSWTVRPEFRSQAMALVMPELRRSDLTITNLTPIPEVQAIFQRLGFRELESSRTSLTANPLARGPGRVVEDPDEVASLLSEDERRIMEDHRGVANHLAVEDPEGGVCHLMWTPVHRHRLPAARIHHLGDPGVFARCVRAVQRHLLLRHGRAFVDLDTRLAGGRSLPGAGRHPLQVPRMFRSPDLEPAEVSGAYSELVLLNV